jgi:hypothetical protein
MKHIPIVAGLLLVFWLLARPNIPPTMYAYDEADYMYVSSLGFAANYTDTPTLPIIDFLRMGLDQGKQSAQRSALSESIRGANDVVYYRHFHGPLYFFGLIPVARLGIDEYGTRMFMLVIPALTVLAIYFGAVWLFPGRQGLLAGFLAAALFAWSKTTAWGTELAPHQLFVLCFVCSLLLLAKMVQTGERRYWYGALVLAGCAVCTLEIAFGLVLTIAICGHVERERLHPDAGLLLKSVAALIGPVVFLWPAALFKLSFLKAYLFMAYLAVFRTSVWGNETFAQTWASRFSGAPVEWLLIATALWIYFRHRDLPGRRLSYVLLVYAVLMIAATLRIKTVTLRYALPFQPALEMFAGFTLAAVLSTWQPGRQPLPHGRGSVTDGKHEAPVLSRARQQAVSWRAYGLAAALAAAALLSTIYQERIHPLRPQPRTRELLTYVREHGLGDKALLVPQDELPTLHYYFPKSRLRGYVDATPPASEVSRPGLDAVLYPSYPIRSEPLAR